MPVGLNEVTSLAAAVANGVGACVKAYRRRYGADVGPRLGNFELQLGILQNELGSEKGRHGRATSNQGERVRMDLLKLLERILGGLRDDVDSLLQSASAQERSYLEEWRKGLHVFPLDPREDPDKADSSAISGQVNRIVGFLGSLRVVMCFRRTANVGIDALAGYNELMNHCEAWTQDLINMIATGRAERAFDSQPPLGLMPLPNYVKRAEHDVVIAHLEDVLKLNKPAAERVVVVSGMTGLGKSTTAKEIACELDKEGTMVKCRDGVQCAI